MRFFRALSISCIQLKLLQNQNSSMTKSCRFYPKNEITKKNRILIQWQSFQNLHKTREKAYLKNIFLRFLSKKFFVIHELPDNYWFNFNYTTRITIIRIKNSKQIEFCHIFTHSFSQTFNKLFLSNTFYSIRPKRRISNLSFFIQIFLKSGI